jgi:transposase, IS30 family
MARHTDITADLGTIPIYFCDPHAPWQRGSNENANGLLRQYSPKQTDMSLHSPEHLRAVENEINTRPRLVLDDRTPTDLFAQLLASPDQPSLRRWLEPALPTEGQISDAGDMGSGR